MKWCVNEMSGVNLGDLRLNRRSIEVLSALSSIGESTPDTMKTKAELDGAYRLMSNKKVTMEALLAPHFEQTIIRTRKESRVLLVQDTTEVNVTKPIRQVDGAGPLSTENRMGFYLHPLMAFTSGGTPLGLVETIAWARESVDRTSSKAEKRKKNKAAPIEEKESYRWLQMLRQGLAIAKDNPDTEYIAVADSESDIYDLFVEMTDCPANYHLVIRACHDRGVLDSDVSDGQNISAVFTEAAIQSQFEVPVRKRVALTKTEKRQRLQSRENRIATVDVRATSMTLRAPQRPGKKLPPVVMNAVEVREANPPEGEPLVCWTLLTTLPVDTTHQILEIIKLYKTRWHIELYFRTLKSGMKLEKMKYQSLNRYLNATALLMIVAWRIQKLTYIARETPDAPCDEFFDEGEWKPVALTAPSGRARSTELVPTIKEFLLMIASLGGYIRRTGQGAPGSTMVWRGMRRMETLMMAYKAFGPPAQNTCEV